MSTRCRRTVVLAVFIFCVGSLIARCATSPVSLKNGRLSVTFNNRGMESIRDIELNKSFRFSEDNFSISVDGRLISSQELTTAVMEQKPQSIRYTFRSGAYQIDVMYELKPDWRFVSKQIFVKSAAANVAFRVNQVTVAALKVIENPQDAYIPQSHWWRAGKEKDYGIFLRYGETGLMALVQNPYLNIRHDAGGFSISYSPDMDWKNDYGPFASDRGCIGPYAMTGNKVSTRQIAEWKMDEEETIAKSPVLDQAEIDAFMNCVRAFVLEKRSASTKINVAWTQNDYQVDTATPEGRQEYKRMIDRAAEMGLEHMVYSGTNSALALEKDDTDSWHWEHTLWLNLGQKIRNGEWDIASSPIPASIQEILNYARSKNVRLIAYVYPVLPFQQNRNWLVGPNKDGANIGNREFQDFLIKSMVTFAQRTGISGYSFDYAWLLMPGYSEYSQWWGWKRVVESLREQVPDIIMDGRQGYQGLGPWTWLAGSYPHPTSTDEQAESFVPFPDLHFDRVSADRQRITAYRYRVNDFCPPELMPGFIGHQTERWDDNGQLVTTRFRARDWDYLGWRYSLLSSIAVAGLHNVMSMIPARDDAEYRSLSKADIDFFRNWLKWTDANRSYLLNTRFILGQPALGKADGTSAIVKDRGYIFLFNPNGKRLSAEFTLDASIGLHGKGNYVLTEIYPEQSKLIGKLAAGLWNFGDKVSIPLDGASARVFEVKPAPTMIREPLAFNTAGQASLQGAKLVLNNVRGEVGTADTIIILLPNPKVISDLTVNGTKRQFTQAGRIVTVPIRFEGTAFSHMQQVGSYDPTFVGGQYSGQFTVPARIFDQLAKRQRDWPIPWTQEDLKTTWLAPQRLLLFVSIAEPKEDMEVPALELDGKNVPVMKAYSSVRRNPGSFVGYYADVSSLEAGRDHKFRLDLPSLKPGQFQGLFFENIESEYTDRILAD